MTNKNNYSVTLLIEDNSASEVWQNEIEQFKNKLIADSQFTEITTYTFQGNEKLLLKDKDKQLVTNIKENTNENNLVFVISDAASMLWKNGEVYNILDQFKLNSLVSIINLLPQHMWMIHEIEATSSFLTTIAPHAKTNKQAIIENPYYEPTDSGTFFPIGSIEEVNTFLYTLLHGGETQSAQVFKNNMPIKDNPNKEKMLPSEKSVYKFRHSVSNEAYYLAAFLSGTQSFTISDVDFVRQHMLPSTNKNILVEFVTGGILELYPNIDSNKETRYKMKEGINNLLLRSLRHTDDQAVQLLLKEKQLQGIKLDIGASVKFKI